MVEEEEPPRTQRRVAAVVVDSLGIDELRSYNGELAAEIARVEAVIERKTLHLGAAETLFRK